MVETTKLGIGIVGAGGIALSHMQALRTSPSARLVTICDAALDRAQSAARAEQVRWTGSLDELLADPEIDAVIVCTPNMTHEALGAKVLEAGKHLLMEKPLAMSTDGARRLVALAEEHGLALTVGHSHRFSDQGLAIRDAIDSGAIGTPRFVRITMNGGWIWGGWDSWVLNPELSGGHSLHNGVHLTDLAAWWMGEQASTVFSVGQKVTSAALAIHDYLVIDVAFPSGASAVCEISRAERSRTNGYLDVTVVGTDGVLSRRWDAEGVIAGIDDAVRAWSPDGGPERTFARELASFVRACGDPSLVEPPPQAAVAAVELAIASERSLVSGRVETLGDAA